MTQRNEPLGGSGRRSRFVHGRVESVAGQSFGPGEMEGAREGGESDELAAFGEGRCGILSPTPLPLNVHH